MSNGKFNLSDVRHKGPLYLTHNEHKSEYRPLDEQWLADQRIDPDDWVSPEERAKALREDSIWELQWYPDTPVGFYRIYASSLEAVIRVAIEKS